ncbi:MAG: hypothetical protein JNK84_16980 [Phreatobacter sp.]|uniref:hypothetical protein n=1 Tax=Phreatobacter sp. TaxID=1966341 RepID=UPI001A5EF5F3|nr:hypothetical protein [Phreatobacter sp.]MBL8570767.1 hypothetical protein [Phreatobacter sp.]
MAQEGLVHVHRDGMKYSFAAVQEFGSSHFGGPLQHEIAGVPYDPAPLHLIGKLGGAIFQDCPGCRRPPPLV